MSKIKFVVILVCVVILVACNGVKDKYEVKGVISEGAADGETVHMSDFNDGIIIDSTKVIGGKFSFKGSLSEPKAVRINLEMISVNLILESGVTSVDLSDPYSTKGSPLTDGLNDFLSKSENLIYEAREKLINIDESASEIEKNIIGEGIVDELFMKMDDLPLPYLKEHPNDILGAMVFYTWMQNQMEPSAEKFNESSKLVGEYVLNFGPVKQLAEYFGKVGNTAVGKPFADFTIENGNLDGSSVSLSDYVGKGKYVLVDFWASWCVPCRMEAPTIAEVYNKYKGDKFNVVSVAVWDQREATIRAIEEDGNTWSQILDAQNIPTDLYGIQGIPHIILIGPDGTILERDLRGNNLKNKIAEVMK